MSVKLLTEHHLEFLSLKEGCKGLSKSILVKRPHCWKSRRCSHQPCGSCTPVCDHILEEFLAAASRLSYKLQGNVVMRNFNMFTLAMFGDLKRAGQGSIEKLSQFEVFSRFYCKW